MLIEGYQEVEVENGDNYGRIRGYVFNFKNDFLPVEYTIRTAGGMNYFEKADIEIIEYFGNMFGVSDREGEVSKIKLHEELVRERWERLKSEMNSKCRVYRIVGMFCGVMTAVLIC